MREPASIDLHRAAIAKQNGIIVISVAVPLASATMASRPDLIEFSMADSD
jgi:hypothetical protein